MLPGASVTHHGVNVEWGSWRVAAGADPRERASLRGPTAHSGSHRAALPPPSPTALLRAETVGGGWGVCWRVCMLRARRLVVSMDTVISLFGWASVMVKTWSSSRAVPVGWWTGRRRWRGGRGQEYLSLLQLCVWCLTLTVRSIFGMDPRRPVGIVKHASGAQWRALDGTTSTHWSSRRTVAVWKRW